MRHIYPINEANCKELYGKPVLIILKDGGEVSGILTSLDKDKITLNGEAGASTSKIRSAKKTASKKNKTKEKAEVSFTPYPYPPGPYSPYGGALVLDLALIALLFALF